MTWRQWVLMLVIVSVFSAVLPWLILWGHMMGSELFYWWRSW